jgi:hypothetical protein
MTERRFTIALHGDPEERAAWPGFVERDFPQYEEFWCRFVVSLTGRISDVSDIWFRSQPELDEEGRPEWHLAVAQLHYSTLLHLARAASLRASGIRDRDSFLEAIVRLDAATDTAFEMLGRCLLDNGDRLPWDEREGKRIRERWERHEGDPFRSLHQYRNALLHGRVRPEFPLRLVIEGGGATVVRLYPKLDQINDVLDWRKADIQKAAPADQIVADVWDQVLSYCRRTWDEQLLPWARTGFAEPKPPPPAMALRIEEPDVQSLASIAEWYGSGSDWPRITATRSASADPPVPDDYSGGSINPPTYPPRTQDD